MDLEWPRPTVARSIIRVPRKCIDNPKKRKFLKKLEKININSIQKPENKKHTFGGFNIINNVSYLMSSSLSLGVGESLSLQLFGKGQVDLEDAW